MSTLPFIRQVHLNGMTDVELVKYGDHLVQCSHALSAAMRVAGSDDELQSVALVVFSALADTKAELQRRMSVEPH